MYQDSNIDYNHFSGNITIKDFGKYIVSWKILTHNTNKTGPLFALTSSKMDFSIGNSPSRTGETLGVDIIDVTNVPVTISLLNVGQSNAYYSDTDKIKASLVIWADKNLEKSIHTHICRSTLQMANIVEQLVTLYPNNPLIIYTAYKDVIEGSFNPVLKDKKMDMCNNIMIVNKEGIFEFIPIEKICAIAIQNNNKFVESIFFLDYLQQHQNKNTDVFDDIQDYLEVGKEVIIYMDYWIKITGSIIKKEYGIIVLAKKNYNEIVFVSTSKISRITTKDFSTGKNN